MKMKVKAVVFTDDKHSQALPFKKDDILHLRSRNYDRLEIESEEHFNVLHEPKTNWSHGWITIAGYVPINVSSPKPVFVYVELTLVLPDA